MSNAALGILEGAVVTIFAGTALRRDRSRRPVPNHRRGGDNVKLEVSFVDGCAGVMVASARRAGAQ